MESFQKVKNFILDLGFEITHESDIDGILVIQNESEGIKNCVLSCSDPILIIEQFLFDILHHSKETTKQLLQMNRDIIHGAFALDESGNKVIFRDTLQLENLDRNEIEGSINSLVLLLSEYSDKIISFSK